MQLLMPSCLKRSIHLLHTHNLLSSLQAHQVMLPPGCSVMGSFYKPYQAWEARVPKYLPVAAALLLHTLHDAAQCCCCQVALAQTALWLLHQLARICITRSPRLLQQCCILPQRALMLTRLCCRLAAASLGAFVSRSC
jgi:hypothetical protein